MTGVYDISGDGRFIVFASRSNLNTVPGNKNNIDGNDEIFLFDYAQRHIFQITDTKDLSADPSLAMENWDPKLSNDGKYIVFSSRATTSTPAVPNSTNPGNFDANNHSAALLQDGNSEIWLYEIPAVTAIDLSEGVVPAFVDLSMGTFRQVTNTNARTPGSSAYTENGKPVVDDRGCAVAFLSILNLTGNNIEENDEIYAWTNERSDCNNRTTPSLGQVTSMPRLSVPQGIPLYVGSPTLSGDGRRIAFFSNATNPVRGTLGGINPDFNGEIFFTDLNNAGNPTGQSRQVTNTNNVDPTLSINTFTGGGERISRNGRYLALESRWQLESANGSLQSSSALFVYDIDAVEGERFRQIGPRWLTDPGLAGNNPEVSRFPIFTDYDSNSEPGTVMFSSRVNMNSQGVVPSNPSEGLNPNSMRQAQVYSYPMVNTTPSFTRLTNPVATNYVACRVTGSEFAGYFARCGRDPMVSNDGKRIVYPQDLNLGTNNFDRDFVYLINPSVTTVIPPENNPLSYLTGASDMTISGENPLAAGLAPNMLGTVMVQLIHMTPEPISTVPTEISTSRKFNAPIELRGARVSIDGYAAQLRGIRKGEINFIVPEEVGEGNKPVTINYKGKILQGTVNIVGTQPDVLRTQACPCPVGGRTKIFNVTMPNNPTGEPFTISTITPNGPQPTRLRAYVTGIKGATTSSISLQIGNVTVPEIIGNPQESDFPGVYTIDFILPASLNAAGDVPLIVTNTINGQTHQSRSAATAAKFNIGVNQYAPTDLALWRPSNGTWYVMNPQGGMQAIETWGMSGDIPAPGDYDGDGKTDFCIFRPSNGYWYLVKSSNGAMVIQSFGTNNDKVAHADYDGDGKTDFAVFRASDMTWRVYQSSNGQSVLDSIGVSGDVVVAADYDGDGKADIALWNNKDAKFLVMNNSKTFFVESSFGQSNDVPVIGDYDGDGKADLATWRPADNIWRIKNSSNGQSVNYQWGDRATDIAVQGDYDADGKTDIAVWRSSGPWTGWWFIINSSTGQGRFELWGITGDIPVPAPYRR